MPNQQQNELKREAEFMRQKALDLIVESVDAGPNRLSEIAVDLTSIKSFFSGKLDEILVEKAKDLPALKEQHGSVASAKLMWASTPLGTNEILLKGIVGRIKDAVSVIRQRINVKADEARGLY